MSKLLKIRPHKEGDSIELTKEVLTTNFTKNNYRKHRDNPSFHMRGRASINFMFQILVYTGYAPRKKLILLEELLLKIKDSNNHLNLLNEDHMGLVYLGFHQHKFKSAYQAFNKLKYLLSLDPKDFEFKEIEQSEKERVQEAKYSIIKETKHILFADGMVWGYDIWYERKPIVVYNNLTTGKTIISVKDKETAINLLGDDGISFLKKTTLYNFKGNSVLIQIRKENNAVISYLIEEIEYQIEEKKRLKLAS